MDIVRAVENRLACDGKFGDERVENQIRCRVKARCRLVEDQNVWVWEQGRRYQHFLAHALGVHREGRIVFAWAELPCREQSIDPRGGYVRRQLPQIPNELQEFSPGHERIDVWLLRHVPDVPAE